MKKIVNRKLIYVVFVLFSLSFTSCVAVKNYERMYVDDADMKLKARNSTKFETAFQVYREGASGANGGKGSGGCGCN